MAIYGSLGDIDVGAISKSISDTAVDVFVYDTRKDSDGGAWRKRTQHTSWYNETLNTATRGSRRDFPAVAVIVATTNTITIYDGDDPDLPMWMKFTDGYSTYLGMGIGGLTSVTMLNGVMVHGGQYDVHVTNFISDKTNRYGDNSGITVNHTQPISGRNNDTAGNYNGPTTPVIVNRQVNDVAMTVLPNAPIDPATGLPVPTIAVATSGGVSVIKDDGNIWDIATNPTSISGRVWLDGINNKVLYTADNTTRYNWIYQFDIPSSDSAPSYLIDPNSIITNYNHNTDFASFSAIPLDSETFTANSVSNLVISNSNEVYVGTNKKIAKVQFDKTYNPRTSLTNFITTTFNTGYLPWNIRGAWLSDTSTTSVTGTELITNGTFTTNTTGWTAANSGTITLSSNRIRVTVGASINGLAYQQITTVVGQWYTISYDGFPQTANTAFGQLYIRDGSISGTVIIASNNATQTTYSHTFQALSTTTFIVLYGSSTNTNGNYAEWDNISLRIAELDRSVNNKGLAVYGTITKTPVTTGADLVSYSGFNASNGLIQPYNSAFDFGTGDYYMSVWAYGGSTDQALMIREEPQGDANGAILIFQYNGYYAFYSRTNGTSTWAAFLSTAPYGNYWSHIYLVRRSGILQGYVNGNLVGSTAFSGSVSNGNAQLCIGKRVPGVTTQYFTGQLALAKIGAGAPSPEQIRKIYEDEKALFQENSKAVLFGSSSAVTALAYDETTKLLSVGTSSGRSDFQGLERINNTTTAVTTAISASNGLIAEQ